MKFACFSDTHEKPPYVDLTEIDADYVLHAGDVYDRLSLGMHPTAFDNIKQWVPFKDRLRAVRGNHDVLDPANIFRDCDVTGRIEELRQDLFLVGLGWYGEHFYELPLERNMADVCHDIFRQACWRIPTGAQTVILTHYPAYTPGIFPDDRQKGQRGQGKPPEGWFFECVAKMVEAFRPLAVIQGHVHSLMGRTGRGDHGTLFVFPGERGGLLTVDTEERTASFDRFGRRSDEDSQ